MKTIFALNLVSAFHKPLKGKTIYSLLRTTNRISLTKSDSTNDTTQRNSNSLSMRNSFEYRFTD